jgi:hypothetical protein
VRELRVSAKQGLIGWIAGIDERISESIYELIHEFAVSSENQ